MLALLYTGIVVFLIVATPAIYLLIWNKRVHNFIRRVRGFIQRAAKFIWQKRVLNFIWVLGIIALSIFSVVVGVVEYRSNASNESNYPGTNMLLKFLAAFAGGYGLWQGARRLDTMFKQRTDQQFSDAVGWLGNESDAAQLMGIHALKKLFWDKKPFWSEEETKKLRRDIFFALVEYLRERSWEGVAEEQKKYMQNLILNRNVPLMKVEDVSAIRPVAARKFDLAFEFLFGSDIEHGYGGMYKRLKKYKGPLIGRPYLRHMYFPRFELCIPYENVFFTIPWMDGAVLDEAFLAYIHFQPSGKTGMQLERAQLHGTILQGAFLQYAKMKYASFNKTDLRGADLSYADLRSETLPRAIFDEKTKINGAIILSKCQNIAGILDADWDYIWLDRDPENEDESKRERIANRKRQSSL